MKSILLADLIKYIHIFLVFFVFVGHSIVPIKYLKYYLIFVIFIFLDWNDYDGMCIFTKLEHYFRYDEWISKPPVEGGPEFFRPLINNFFNLNLSTNEADRLNNFLFIISWAIGFIRLIKEYNI